MGVYDLFNWFKQQMIIMLIWCWVSHLHCLSAWNFCESHFYQYLVLLRLICFFLSIVFLWGEAASSFCFSIISCVSYNFWFFLDSAVHFSKAICYDYKHYLLMTKLFFCIRLKCSEIKPGIDSSAQIDYILVHL